MFDLIDHNLKNSKNPLKSFIILHNFKYWLINRIEIIEKASNRERELIYDKESFMCMSHNTPKLLDKQNKILVQIMDALYSTLMKFKSNKQIVKLSYEVI